jgi:hypothetical protein
MGLWIAIGIGGFEDWVERITTSWRRVMLLRRITLPFGVAPEMVETLDVSGVLNRARC